jgi:hypothetical protein
MAAEQTQRMRRRHADVSQHRMHIYDLLQKQRSVWLCLQ